MLNLGSQNVTNLSLATWQTDSLVPSHFVCKVRSLTKMTSCFLFNSDSYQLSDFRPCNSFVCILISEKWGEWYSSYLLYRDVGRTNKIMGIKVLWGKIRSLRHQVSQDGAPDESEARQQFLLILLEYPHSKFVLDSRLTVIHPIFTLFNGCSNWLSSHTW